MTQICHAIDHAYRYRKQGSMSSCIQTADPWSSGSKALSSAILGADSRLFALCLEDFT